jgi:hypothetical protein
MLEAIPSAITQVKTLSQSIRLTVDTQENLTPETFAKLFGLKDKVGWFFFAEHREKLPGVIDTSQLPPIPQREDGQKSPSERLRNVLFVYWKKKTDQKQDFELWRVRWMEKLITNIKEQLN